MTSPDLRDQLQAALGTSYTLERELGGGGMSRVFVATDTTLGRQVVVKVLLPELAAALSVERFRREITLAARLQFPHIVPLLTAGEAAGLPYFTMPYVEGASLRTRLTKEGPLPLLEAISVLRDIAKALSYAHKHGIVHRDVKPDNVLVSGGAATVTDFGVAKAICASTTLPSAGPLTQAGMSIGTPAYMAPEQAAADPNADHRIDIYAFGATAYELLTGEPPFGRGPPAGLLAAHLVQTPRHVADVRPDVPEALANLIMRCLAKDPDGRPGSALQLAHSLEDLRDPAGIGGPAASTAHARSIAVLPFANLSSDPENEYLADGIAEEVINALAKLDGLRVAARTSTFAFKGHNTDVRRVGAQLNVATVLEGSVRRVANRLRVTAQLIKAEDGYHLRHTRHWLLLKCVTSGPGATRAKAFCVHSS